MKTAILQSKLHIPPARPNFVPRLQLYARLDEGLQPGNRLIILSAPAGYGKSALLGAWIQNHLLPDGDISAVWFSIDEADDDPIRFWAYVTAALQNIPGVPAAVDPNEISSCGNAYLTELINQISVLSRPALLVLDDLHWVASLEIHNGLSFFLDRLPPSLKLVIATRADPPMNLASLRAKGGLVELRQRDLRFSPGETAAFLRDIMGLELGAGEIEALETLTEGWAAGLQMAGLSMQQREDMGAFLRSFSGSHRYIMDYLIEEVLSRQPEEMQNFLLQTSILERLSSSLCDAVLRFQMETDTDDGQVLQSSSNSQAILENLEASNLFITPLDDNRSWYRYHRLFADLLQKQLAQRQPKMMSELHHRASIWFENESYLQEGIDHALAAREYERAADLIAKTADSLLMRSEVVTLRKWLDALPQELISSRSNLSAHYAFLMMLSGESIELVRTWLNKVKEQGVSESGPLLSFQGLLALYEGDLGRAVRIINEALKKLENMDGFWIQMAQWLKRMLSLSESNLDNGLTEKMEPFLDAQIVKKNVLLGVMCLSSLGELRMKQGQMNEAENLFQQALELATDDHGNCLPIAGEALKWLGEVARERNDLDAAEEHLNQGIKLLHEWGQVTAIEGHLSLALVKQAQGDIEKADKAIKEAQSLAVMFDAMQMDDFMVAMHRAHIAVLRGDFEKADQWIKARGLDKIDPDELQIDATVELHMRKYELVTLGLVRIRQHLPNEALSFLDPLLAEVLAKGRWRLGMEILALQAAAHHLLGETEKALDCLKEALRIAEPEGYVRFFLNIGEPMAQLLYKAAERGIMPEYAGVLLAAFPPGEQVSQTRKHDELIEPLSEREKEVVAAIAEGLSNQEIALRLFISEQTVKWHASNIYGKLQVSNRTEAAAKARALGLLSS